MDYGDDLQHLHQSEDRHAVKAGWAENGGAGYSGARWWQQPITSRLLLIVSCVCAALIILNIGITVANPGKRNEECDPAKITGEGFLQKLLSAVNDRRSFPRENETFGDGACPDDWSQSQSSCYYFSNLALTWTEAQSACRRRSSTLTVINTPQEQDFLTKFSMKTRVWIGLSEVDGEWQWVDGTPFASTPKKWGPGQPDEFVGHGLGGGEDCVQFTYSGDWNDEHCSRAYRYICERSARTT